MATCNVDTLLQSACDNGFFCVADDDVRGYAIAAQLLKSYAGSSQSASELLADAVANGFWNPAQNDTTFFAVASQLLCNSGG